MYRSCSICGASFKNSTDETGKRLKNHLNICDKDDPFLDDEDADFYDEL